MRSLDFSKVRVLIVGDIMLDRYYYGSVSRISPEAPVPVVAVESDIFTLGGAGNVANNIAGLKAKCRVFAAAANDSSGKKLYGLLDDIGTSYSFIDTGAPTTTKLRVIGEKQQIVRVDFEEIKPITSLLLDSLKDEILRYIGDCDCIVISDYGKGICTPDMCGFVISEAKKVAKPVVVDPKGSDWSKYNGATIITPNVKELGEAIGAHVKNYDYDIVSAGQSIREKYAIDYLIVTRSEKGMTIISGDSYKHIPTKAREVFDVSGAGDTVVAATAVALGAGCGVEEAVETANTAAGIVVGKIGTAPITADELMFAVNCEVYSKIVSFSEIGMIAENERRKGKKIVFTNGCFDILHRGHVTYLRKAASMGDLLIVGLNSDASVKRLKGSARPVNRAADRAEVLSALHAVDYVVVFDEDTPLELVKTVKPDVLVKGGDYKACDVVGREYAKSVSIIDFVVGYSTTEIIKKLNGGNI